MFRPGVGECTGPRPSGGQCTRPSDGRCTGPRPSGGQCSDLGLVTVQDPDLVVVSVQT